MERYVDAEGTYLPPFNLRPRLRPRPRLLHHHLRLHRRLHHHHLRRHRPGQDLPLQGQVPEQVKDPEPDLAAPGQVDLELDLEWDLATELEWDRLVDRELVPA